MATAEEVAQEIVEEVDQDLVQDPIEDIGAGEETATETMIEKIGMTEEMVKEVEEVEIEIDLEIKKEDMREGTREETILMKEIGQGLDLEEDRFRETPEKGVELIKDLAVETQILRGITDHIDLTRDHLEIVTTDIMRILEAAQERSLQKEWRTSFQSKIKVLNKN